MSKLPDFEALAIFAKVVEMRSFAGAASELGLKTSTFEYATSREELAAAATLELSEEQLARLTAVQ